MLSNVTYFQWYASASSEQQEWHQAGSLKLTIVEIFTPQKGASATEIKIFIPKELVVKYLSAHHCLLLQ